MFLVSKRDKNGCLLFAKVVATPNKVAETASALIWREHGISMLFRQEMNAVMTYDGTKRLQVKGVTIEPILE